MSAAGSRAAGMHTPRVVTVAVVAVLTAFVVQTAVLPALGASAAVPVVLATVVVVGMAWGPGPGAVAGFGAGLLLDVTGSGVLGMAALVGCLAGVAAARIPTDRWWWSGAGLAVLLTIAGAWLIAAVNALLHGRYPGWSLGWLWVAGGAAVCLAILLPLRGWLREVVR
ncbi:MAG: rod shape-determining protein MreD [Micrococcales bacterium]|nr:rod shape-determining protein MreD [Micrococcales bacterium]